MPLCSDSNTTVLSANVSAMRRLYPPSLHMWAQVGSPITGIPRVYLNCLGSKPSFLTKLLSISVQPPSFSFLTNYFFMKTVLSIGLELVDSMVIYSFKSKNYSQVTAVFIQIKAIFYKRKYYIINGFISMKTTCFVCIRPFPCYFLMILKKLGNIELSINLPTFNTLVKTRSVTYFLET